MKPYTTHIALEAAPADTACNCGCCGWQGKADQLDEIEEAALTPGDPAPAGRCPECRNLAYVKEASKPAGAQPVEPATATGTCGLVNARQELNAKRYWAIRFEAIRDYVEIDDVWYQSGEALDSKADELRAPVQAQPVGSRHLIERWNIKWDGDDLLICFNDHEKSEACEPVRYVAAAPIKAQPVERTYSLQECEAYYREGIADGKKEMRDARAQPVEAAPVVVNAPELTDVQLLSLNAGERFFSESPSKYPEAGHGTQYHAGAPGVIAFARAALAASRTKPATPEPEGDVQLWACDQAIGKDYLITSGPRAAMQAEADKQNAKGDDYFVRPPFPRTLPKATPEGQA
jgi:hypothetical protein